jgi:hypothetical protein
MLMRRGEIEGDSRTRGWGGVTTGDRQCSAVEHRACIHVCVCLCKSVSVFMSL